MFLGRTYSHFVVFLEATGNFAVVVITEAGGDPAALPLVSSAQHDKLTFALTVDRTDRQSEHTLALLERNPNGGRHLWAENPVSGRLKPDDSDIVDDVVTNLGLGINRRDLPGELVLSVGIDSE